MKCLWTLPGLMRFTACKSADCLCNALLQKKVSYLCAVSYVFNCTQYEILPSLLPLGLRLIMMTLLSLVSLAAVHYFTFEHPYFLADNRHYPFYVW